MAPGESGRQPGSPFQLLETLGSCQVGKVWSAVDAEGRAVTVAVLDAAVAADQHWRNFFASTANALRDRDGTPSFLHADFSAPAPWVAYAAGTGARAEQVFVALGMEYRPTSSSAQTQPTDPSTIEPPWAKLAIAEPTQALPTSTAGTSGNGERSAAAVEGPPDNRQLSSQAGGPVSAPPSPVSVPPSPAPDTPSPWSNPYPTSQPPLTPAVPRRSRRTGLRVGIAVAVVVALGAVVGIFAWRSAGGAPSEAGSSPSPSAAVSSSPEPVAFPTGVPRKPGVEPPKPGSWPAEPQFDDTDRVRAESPAGFGFTFKVPESWACDARQHGPGFARHLCGISRPGTPEVGGEIIVRNCPEPCGAEVQAAYRRAEEAWGLQWVQAGNATFAETAQLNGQARYGVVVIGWWRSSPDGPVDRQIVIRMTGVGAQVSEVRKVVNGIRATLAF